MASPIEREAELDAILGAYHDDDAAGDPPGRLELIARHPAFAAELAAYFLEQDRLFGLAAPLRVAAAADPAEAPRTLGDYELIEELARGGMGIVYEARQRSLNRPVALKLILSGEFAGPAEIQRFHAEAEAAAQLDHPNIVPIFEVGSHQSRHFFSMKLLEGGSLARRLHEFGSDHRKAAQLVATIARAVHYAHQRGILHRDLKPSNILLDGEDQPHVADFGLAKRLGSGAESTRSGVLIGSPPYMAPEQAEGAAAAITTATDVYGLGAILYTVLAGRAPFAGESILETLSLVRTASPPPLSTAVRKVDHDLQTICLACLEKDPTRRYASAQELALDLGRWLDGEPISARHVGPLERAWRWCRRNAVVASLAATIVCLLLLVIGGLVASNRAIDRERAEALTQRDRSVKGLKQTRQALDEVLTHLISMPFFSQGQHRLQGVRKGLLEKAMALYQAVYREQAGEPTLDAEAGQTANRLGDVFTQLERHAEAAQAYLDAIRHLDGSRPQDSRGDQARSDLLKARLGLARAYLDLGHSDRAEREYRQTLERAGALRKDEPSESPLHERLAYGCRDLGELLLAAGRPAEADGFLRRSEEAFRQIIAGHGVSDGGLQFQLAVVLSGRASAARGRGDVEGCLRLKREAVSLLETARQARPFSPAYMRRQCEYLEGLAGSLAEAGRRDEALTLLEKARRTSTTMASSFPDLGDLRQQQAESSARIARLLLQMRRDSDAEQAFRESLRVYQETVAAYPEVPAYRQGEARIRQELEALLKRPGGLDRADRGAATSRGSDRTPATMNLNPAERPR